MVKRTVRRRRGGAEGDAEQPGLLSRLVSGVTDTVGKLNPFKKADAPASESLVPAASGSDGVPAGQQGGRRRKTTRLSRRARRTRRQGRKH